MFYYLNNLKNHHCVNDYIIITNDKGFRDEMNSEKKIVCILWLVGGNISKIGSIKFTY